jgi:hypothetical protein
MHPFLMHIIASDRRDELLRAMERKRLVNLARRRTPKRQPPQIDRVRPNPKPQES